MYAKNNWHVYLVLFACGQNNFNLEVTDLCNDVDWRHRYASNL